jgi:hypothetical protein
MPHNACLHVYAAAFHADQTLLSTCYTLLLLLLLIAGY